MKKIVGITLVLTLLVAGSLTAAVDTTRADELYEIDAFTQAEGLLEEQLAGVTNDADRAEILWRLARLQVSLGDELDEDDKDGRFAFYEKGEQYALQSIEANTSWEGYLWKCSNIGRWGQTKGPLNALGKAKGMLEDLTTIVNTLGVLDSSETWYVLSSLYDELPGGFISFGNKEWAVSYMRIAMDTIPSHLYNPGHYLKLAEELYARDWSASKRSKEMRSMEKDWKKGSTNLEKYRYYEGKDGGKSKPFYSSVTLDKMSDRQEAVMVLSYALAKANILGPVKASDADVVEEIQELINDWT
ncbi:hypothetical protein [uncultured Sphaerochaeta sp.]|uniref:hypothetical protein n=1 Tax=uncultured Sphaerochaeta sp. TaxID=886478 RepID=UPI002AA8BAFA|nr:hypothetical protein [uncultured Sphaerochaeta sp.]